MAISMTLLSKLLAAIACLLLITGYVYAHDGGGSPFSGTVACGGFYKMDNSQRFRLVLRNINEQADIKITRMRVYYKDGTLAVDTNNLGFLPPGLNNILGPSNDTLEPHQTELYYSEHMFGYGPGQIPPLQQGSVQTIIEWSSNANAKPLQVTLVRHVYDLLLTGKPVARSSGKCDSLP